MNLRNSRIEVPKAKDKFPSPDFNYLSFLFSPLLLIFECKVISLDSYLVN